MEGLFVFLAIVGLLVVLDAAALLWGVDSRPGSSDVRAPIQPGGLIVR